MMNPNLTTYEPLFDDVNDQYPFYHFLIRKGKFDLFESIATDNHAYNIRHSTTKMGASIVSVAAKYLNSEDFVAFFKFISKEWGDIHLQSAIKSRDKTGRTAIFYAAESLHKDSDKIIDILIDNGLFAQDTDYYKVSPVSIAISRGNLDALKVLLPAKADTEKIVTGYEDRLKNLKVQEDALAASIADVDLETLVPFQHRLSLLREDIQKILGKLEEQTYTQEHALNAARRVLNYERLDFGRMTMTAAFGGRRRNQQRTFYHWSTNEPKDPNVLYDVTVILALLSAGDHPGFPVRTAPEATVRSYYRALKARSELFALRTETIPSVINTIALLREHEKGL